MTAGDIKTVAVLGAGTMGHGIAEVNLLAGLKVTLQDINQEALDRGVAQIDQSLNRFVNKGLITPRDCEKMMKERLLLCLNLETAVQEADLVIEAVSEVMTLKKEIFKKIDQAAPSQALLASNTSTMSISQIASVTRRPEKVLGLHYFTPVVFMKLVEIIRGQWTSEETMQTAYDFCLLTDRVPLRVEKDTPGFIANRVSQFPKSVLLGCILDEGLAEPEEIDGPWRRLGVPVAPYEMMDYAGLDIFLGASRYLTEVLHPDYRPSRKIEELVKAGRLGRKTGKGIYDYHEGKPILDISKSTDEITPLDLMAVIINEGTKLIEEGLCTADDIDKTSIYGLGTERGPMAYARELDPAELTLRLERLADRFHKEIFRPTRMIREGRYR
jgi:enoyl-CoA hydratase / 3-hydroxyacyl-CoA dehydrogenase